MLRIQGATAAPRWPIKSSRSPSSFHTVSFVYEVGIRSGDYRGQGLFTKELYQVLYECLDLYHRGLVNSVGDVAFGPTDIAPGEMTARALRVDLCVLMKLGKILENDLASIAAQLR